MKKTLLMLAMAFIGSQAIGQISSGSLFVSGMGSVNSNGNSSTTTVGNTTTTVEYPKTFSGQFGIGAGYFLTDNIAVGLNLGLSGSKVSSSDTTYTKSSGFNAGLFGRYYVPVADNFYFFGNLGVGFGTGKSTVHTGNTDTDGPKTSAFNLGIQPGFAFFPTPKFGFDMTVGNLGFSSMTSKQEGTGVNIENKTTDFDLNANLLTVNFGIQYFLGN